MKAAVAAAGLLALAQLASAQPRTYSGTWQVSWTIAGQQTQPMTAQLELQGLIGTWITNAPSALQRSLNPCIGKPQPVWVDDYDNQLLIFSVYASEAALGCPDFQLTLKRAGGGRLRGVLSDGTEIVATQD